MKRALLLLVIVAICLIAFAGSAMALHRPDVQASNCYRCHSTHAGVTGLLLTTNGNLPKTPDNVQVNGEAVGIITPSTICLACHDGTSSYRSVTGTNNQRMYLSGVFDVTNWTENGSANMSAHTVDIAAGISKTIATAPGNTKEGHHLNTNDDFSCVSCHNPHGSFRGDYRGTGTLRVHNHLKLNPNDSIDGKFKQGYTWSSLLEQKPEVVHINLVRVGDGIYEEALIANGGTANGPWLRSYVSNRDAIVANRYVKYPVAVKIGGQWVFNTETTATGTAAKVSFSVNATTNQIRFDKPLVQADPGTATLEARVFKPIIMHQSSTFAANFTNAAGEPVTVSNMRKFSVYSQKVGPGEGKTVSWGVNRWCGACHSNYDIADRTVPYEVDNASFHGHNVYRNWNDSYATPYSSNNLSNCLSCHYAHGTRNDLMMDSNKQIVGTRAGIGADPKPANKRYYGGSVCLACHQTSHTYLFLQDSDTVPADKQWR
jgi:hypothetical protein